MNAASDTTAGPVRSTSRSSRITDVLAIGESMAVVTPLHRQSLEHAHQCQLSVGGAESNVLIQLARSGLRTRLVTRIGDDALGRRTMSTIAAAGVDVSRFEVDPLRPTGVCFKDRGGPTTHVSYYRRGSAASTLDVASLAGAGIRESRALFLTGITPALSPELSHVVEQALSIAREHNVTIFFDVNYRPALWPRQRAAHELLEAARRADVVFVGLDEAHALWGTDTPADVRDRLGVWPGSLIVKDGSVGATEFHPGGVEFAPTESVAIVEEVGAGDAFAAGYIAAAFARESVLDRLLRGHRQASLALSSIGDLPS